MKTITDHPFLIRELLVRAEHRKQRRRSARYFLHTPLGITVAWLVPMVAMAALIDGGLVLMRALFH